jgi:hypothetical protein
MDRSLWVEPTIKLCDRVDVKRNQTRGSAFRVRFKPSINPLLRTTYALNLTVQHTGRQPPTSQIFPLFTSWVSHAP